MTIYQRNKRWAYRETATRPDGTRVRISGAPGYFGLPNTKEGARAAAAKHLAHTLATGEVHPPGHRAREVAAPAPRLTLAGFAPTFLEAAGLANKASTVDTKRWLLDRHILPALGGSELGAIGYAQIEDFKVRLSSTLGAKSVNNVVGILHRMLVVAKKRGELAALPEVEWMRPDAPEFDWLRFDEADALMAAARDEWASMIRVAIRTGLRRGELLGLRWDDVDLPGRRIIVRQSIVRGKVTTTKSRKPREVPLTASAVAALKSQRHLRGPLVWCGVEGKPLAPRTMARQLDNARRRAKLRPIGWHVLRHTFASHLAMRSVPILTIQKLCGHATIAMTLRYAHLAPVALVEAVDALEAVTAVTNDSRNRHT